MRQMIGKLFIVSAPSGAGKTTLVNEVIKTFKSQFNLNRVITYTTRPQRPCDIHGKDYYFISKQEFEQKIHENFFLEYSCEYGNYYGSPCHIMDDLKAGKSYCMIVDLVGARALHQKINTAVFIWIYPKSLEILKQRLIKRNSDDMQEIERRLQLANKEMMNQHLHDIFTHEILNDDFEIARKSLTDLIQKELAKLTIITGCTGSFLIFKKYIIFLYKFVDIKRLVAIIYHVFEIPSRKKALEID